MKSILVAALSAALVVALYAAFGRPVEGGGETPDNWRAAPAVTATEDLAAAAAAARLAAAEALRNRFQPVPVAAGGLEAEHLKRGALGRKVKELLASTLGNDWRRMDRLKAATAVHGIVAEYQPEDAAYLLQVFAETKDPAFRWWFAALVRQLKDDVFADAVAEVYRVDPIQASETLGWVGGPKSMAHLTTLLDTQGDADVRSVMFGAIARSTWEGKADYFAKLAGDPRRGDVDRMHAMFALGRHGTDAASLDYLVATALGPEHPVSGLGNLEASHPVRDLRSAAVLGVVQRGDQDALRRLLDAADTPGADPRLAQMVDGHLGSYSGPDLSQFLYARAARRRQVTLGEALMFQRHWNEADRETLAGLRDFAVDDDVKRILDAVLAPPK
jgi:hypothetical protein